ncbi:DUF2332 domain-containing protein [Lentibacillus sediminis]|uniref:DUF2332 domain-containing protein n=1 Tax=Lentibacillus sediminis TaxID=1940529 RepID=UPI000C1BB828|nr:DUF2332 domain-containing protein [Lentibacillus sediminis]
MDKAYISHRFKTFAHDECRGSSQLYEDLSLNIAEDDILLKLCEHAGEGQPVPNLLFGAVHYLLMEGKQHELRKFYQSLVPYPEDADGSFLYFRDFCHTYYEEILRLLENKLVQTNEVRRCSFLYPSFCYIYELAKRPLALVEIGTSAGLQLLWDKYSYSYGTDERYGNERADVHIRGEVSGSSVPFLLEESPPVASRTGVDLHINDLRKLEDRRWLEALIWPEHVTRRKLFSDAAYDVINTPLELLEGNGVELLPKIARTIPEDTALCVFHTHVANQMPKAEKTKLLQEIGNIGRERDVFHLYNNMQDRDLHLDYYLQGKAFAQVLAKTDGHGRWFTWENVKNSKNQEGSI